MAWASWRAVSAAVVAAADVLLAVGDAVGSASISAEIGSTCLAEHGESLHKSERALHQEACRIRTQPAAALRRA